MRTNPVASPGLKNSPYYIPFPKQGFKALVLSIVFLSLIGSVTNYVTISSLSSLLILFAPLLVCINSRLKPISLSILGLWLLFFLSTLTYAPQSFLEYNFYRRDGNFFISFAPLLSLSLMTWKIDVERWADFFLRWITLATIPAMLYFLNNKPFSTDHRIFSLYFYSHNAAGGVLCLATCVAIGFYLDKRKYFYLFLSCLNFFAALLTFSRGSVLAFLLASFTFFCVKKKNIKYLLISLVVLHLPPLFYGYQFWMRNPSLSNASIIGEAIEENNLNFHKAGTVVDRLFVIWPRAIDLFMKSPILGTGFGSYNDTPHQLEGIENVIMINSSKNLTYDAGHAHHSYLHVLAENGLIGIFLLCFCLYQIYQFIDKIESKSLKVGLCLAFWMNFYSSFTEHRLFTPSQMLPFFILLGLCVCSSHLKKDASTNHLENKT